MELSIVTKYVIEEFRKNPLVNTISVSKQSEIDFNKANIYPIVNIDLISSDIVGNVHRFTYVIHILQQRDLKSETNLDNKLLNTNMIDNLNETYSVATKFINNIRSYNNEFDIDVFFVTPITMLKYNYSNLLDGVTFSVTLDIPDSTGC